MAKSKNKQWIKYRKDKKKFLKSNSERLNNHLPQSEKWFRSLYDDHFKLYTDVFNKPFHNHYLPDVANHEFKYIIEIDGSIHTLPEVKEKDLKKEKFYNSKGYTVFRVKAHNLESYFELIVKLYIYRKISKPTKLFNDLLLTKGLDFDMLLNKYK